MYKRQGKDNPLLINDERYSPAGVLAPKKTSDFAFIMHALHHLTNDGKAAIVCFPTIMSRTGVEQKIRKYLVDNNFIDLVVQLPDKLFYGTQIATCIMVLSKNKNSSAIMFIDAPNEYQKITNANQLTEANISKIVDHYLKQREMEYFSKIVDYASVVDNNYDLSVGRYVKRKIFQNKLDIVSLNKQISETVSSINSLRSEIDAIIKALDDEY